MDPDPQVNIPSETNKASEVASENTHADYGLQLTDGIVIRGQTTILNKVNAKVPAGGTLALVGPSGSGKTSILRALLGLLPLNSGQVMIGNTVLTPQNVNRLRAQFGYVRQDGALFPHLNVYDNVALPLRHAKVDAKTIRQRIEWLTDLVELSPNYWRRYDSQLSGGQRQRVAVMRALALSPKILLMDEPLGALDPMLRPMLHKRLVAIINQLGLTCVIVTHDLIEADGFSKRLLLMHESHVTFEGSLSDMLRCAANTPFLQAFTAGIRLSHHLEREI